MSIASVTANPLANLLYQKLFRQADANADGAVSGAEFNAAGQDLPATAALFGRLDRDSDGAVTSGEIPTARLDVMRLAEETLAGALAEQGWNALDQAGRAAADKRAVEALFARADLNGDKTLDAEEMAAETALRRVQAADGGARGDMALPVVKADRLDSEGGFSAEDFAVLRIFRLPTQGMAPTPIDETLKARLSLRPVEATEIDPAPTRRQRVETDLTAGPLSAALMARLIAHMAGQADGYPSAADSASGAKA